MWVAVLILGTASPAWAGEQDATPPPSYMAGALRKLGRGAANVLSCLVEFPRTIELVMHEDGYAAGLSVGALQGAWRTVQRAAAGIYEVATFPLEVPKGWKPLVRPEFVLGANITHPEEDR